jgi:oligopeptide/dipeptide ABC transporter ATP-binding protein
MPRPSKASLGPIHGNNRAPTQKLKTLVAADGSMAGTDSVQPIAAVKNIVGPAGRDPDTTKPALLTVRNVTKTFGTNGWSRHLGRANVLSDVSMSIAPGKCVGLVGESGSGKSTLVRCILGLERPDSGEIALAGRQLGHAGLRSNRRIRAQIQPIFQNPASSLNPRRRIGRIIGEPLRVHGRHTDRQVRERVRELLELVELPADCEGRYPQQLSGGQKQRVSIARALALNPRLIVADEATSALDVLVQNQIVELLARIRAEHGISMLFVSHNLAITSALCEEILVMYAGRIVEYGPTDSVTTSPKHPYTQSLIRAVPGLNDPSAVADSAMSSAVLFGDPPSPFEMPDGCRFASRCPRVMDICTTVNPAPAPTHGAGAAACHLLTA